MAENQELEQAKGKVEEAAENLQQEVQTDIERMQATVGKLRAAGEDLFAQQIKEIETKIEVEKERIAAQAEAAKKEVTATIDQVEETVTNKYGKKAWEIIKAVALAAILYGLFGR